MKIKVRGDSVPKPVLRFRHCIKQEKGESAFHKHGSSYLLCTQLIALLCVEADQMILFFRIALHICLLQASNEHLPILQVTCHLPSSLEGGPPSFISQYHWKGLCM